ncbi:unnamed protein product [Aureobasidium pullulans]|nr:unnamed protein product [Aureobasidium pullulans]CAD0053546.1 unnamed protein product [Aureobasidium pullulans]
MHTSALQRARQLSITRKTTTASQHARLNSSPHTTTCHLAHFGSSTLVRLSLDISPSLKCFLPLDSRPALSTRQLG